MEVEEDMHSEVQPAKSLKRDGVLALEPLEGEDERLAKSGSFTLTVPREFISKYVK